MIENGPLLAALLAKAQGGWRSSLMKYRGRRLARRRPTTSISGCRTARSLSARLLVAADGAHSSIRERAGIATHGWDYGQSSIVTTVRHERDHNGRAEEHFLPAGPFAILPLKRDATGHRSSIVWTEAAARGRAHRRARR